MSSNMQDYYATDLYSAVRRFMRKVNLTDAAGGVYRALNACDPTDLDSAKTIEQVRIIVSAWLSAAVAARHQAKGTKLKDWGTRGPAYNRELRAYTGGFIDHPYRVVREDGRQSFVSEPYSLGTSQIIELAELILQGWEVDVSGDGMHYPHRTVKVVLEPRVGGLDEGHPKRGGRSASEIDKWLTDRLADGPVRSLTIWSEAEALGFGTRALNSASTRVGVVKKRHSEGNTGAGGWWWYLKYRWARKPSTERDHE